MLSLLHYPIQNRSEQWPRCLCPEADVAVRVQGPGDDRPGEAGVVEVEDHASLSVIDQGSRSEIGRIQAVRMPLELIGGQMRHHGMIGHPYRVHVRLPMFPRSHWQPILVYFIEADNGAAVVEILR